MDSSHSSDTDSVSRASAGTTWRHHMIIIIITIMPIIILNIIIILPRPPHRLALAREHGLVALE
jgi:hypothetical protein